MKAYFEYTRAPWYSYLSVLPLLALYVLVAIVANLGQSRTVINGADALVQNLLSFVGLHGWLGSALVLAGAAGVLAYRADTPHRKGPLRLGYLGGMLAESALYTLVFGSVVALLTSLILPFGGFLRIGNSINWGQKLGASLGAGLYEELVFRLVLTGGLIWCFRKLSWTAGAAVTGAVLASSFLFSLFHYVGPGSERVEIASFTFRFVAGVVLAGLYALRGFGIAAWTHALYNVFLLFSGHA